MRHAVLAGYRHIDCARVYENESEVGAALKDLFRNHGIKRENLYVVSKVFDTLHTLLRKLFQLQILPSFGTHIIGLT